MAGGFFAGPKKVVLSSGTILDEAKLAPTQPNPQEVGQDLTPPILYTLDASDTEEWVYFDFSRGSVVKGVAWDSLDWDLAFKRAKILTNSGRTHEKGGGGALALMSEEFDSVDSAPEGGAFETDHRPYNKMENENAALHKWYKYNYINHRLEPKPQVYIIRTAEGKFAKMRILSYYCQGEKAGCYTFRYVYQGNGSRRFTPRP